MSIVVSNGLPVCYLRLIDQIHLFPAIFGEVIIPESVARELGVEGAPEPLRQWIEQPPQWLKILNPEVGSSSGSGLERLHAGERDVILLALQIQADFVVMDEKAARKAARDLGLRVTSLLGILDESASRGTVDFVAAVEKLRETNFRASPQLLKTLLDRHYSH